MKHRSVIAVWRKELLEIVRDRRALVTTLLIPTLVMPLLLFGFGLIASKVTRKALSEKHPVMLLGAENSPGLAEAVRSSEKLSVGSSRSDWRTAIADKHLRAVLEIPADFDRQLEAGGSLAVKIYHYEGEMRSGMAQSELRRVLGDYRDKIVSARLSRHALPPDLIRPYEIRSENVAPPEKVGGNLIGGIIPYMFILFCISGALYPAIDLTAGEKERGTLETVLSSPVGRLELALGKLLAVFSAAIVTILCSLLSMGLSFLVAGIAFADKLKGLGMMAGKSGAAAGVPTLIDPWGLAMILVLAVPLALFTAALLLALALNARTTKEAQSTCSPLIVVAILPAMMGMLPGVELNLSYALVPILNLALVSKELLSGVWHWGLITLVFFSSLAYAGLAVAFCVRRFNQESVLFRT